MRKAVSDVICTRCILLTSMLYLCMLQISAQTVTDTVAGEKKEKTRVYLLHADKYIYNTKTNPDAPQVVVGNVRWKHENMYMYCDSALLYENTNSFEAFQNVRMEQGDTLYIYGDYLHYDGNTQLAKLRNHVRLVNRNTELTTEFLDYDRLKGLGYYFNGGQLTDEQNKLTSDWGEYSPSSKIAMFKRLVHLTNPRFVMDSDTLKYSTQSKIATILGPSNMVSDSTHIYSERGIYNTVTEQSELLNRSIVRNGSSTLIGDSVFYDKLRGYGEAFHNVVMNDSVKRNMLVGQYCFYNQLTDYALATDSAVAIDYSQTDTLYMHADTLKMITYNYNTDSVYRKMHAYHKVRTYRRNMQAVCDSLVFSSKDSCLTMYDNPIIWTGNQQLLGEEVQVFMNDSTIDWAHIINQALVVEQRDSVAFNQISGKEIKAYFLQGKARQVDVIGNALTAYYAEEEGGGFPFAFFRIETSIVNLFLENGLWQKVIFHPTPSGTGYPLLQIPSDQLRLPSFAWFDYVRPLNKDDIFRWRGKGAESELKKTERKASAPPRQLLNPNLIN